jgi:hypothetical protein
MFRSWVELLLEIAQIPEYAALKLSEGACGVARWTISNLDGGRRMAGL